MLPKTGSVIRQCQLQCPVCPKADIDPRFCDVAKVPNCGVLGTFVQLRWLINQL
jgi:hypothetical protein